MIDVPLIYKRHPLERRFMVGHSVRKRMILFECAWMCVTGKNGIGIAPGNLHHELDFQRKKHWAEQ